MEKKMLLLVNCALCDARNVQESTLAAYEHIIINSGLLLTGPETRALLDQYSVTVNTSQSVDMEGIVACSTINGRGRISPAQAVPAGKVFLSVNGTVEVEPGCEEILGHYVGMSVNGCISCPESLAALLPISQLNGTLETYPDGCVRLKRTFHLDRTFHLRAKRDACYFAARRIVALAPDIGFASLAEKNVHFTTKTLLVAESLVEAAAPLFNGGTDIVVLPDGCAFVGDDATLDEALLRRCGGKLYINGSLTLNQESLPCLDQVSYLRVNGDLLATREAAEKAAGLDAGYQQLRIIAGTRLKDRISLTVDRALLEKAADGVDIFDCVNVKFREDVPAELIREKVLSLRDCVSVRCTEEQRAALESVAEEVVSIGGEGILKQAGGVIQQLAESLGLDLDSMSAEEKGRLLKNSKMVNASTYTL